MTDENLLCRTYSALHRNQGLSFPISYTLCDVVAHWLQMGWCSHTLQEVRDSQPAAFCHKKAGETFWRVAVPCHLPNNLPLRAAAGFQGAADVNSHAMQEWHRRAILTECNPLEKLTLTEARRGKQRGTYTPSPPKKNGKAGVTVVKNCSRTVQCWPPVRSFRQPWCTVKSHWAVSTEPLFSGRSGEARQREMIRKAGVGHWGVLLASSPREIAGTGTAIVQC